MLECGCLWIKAIEARQCADPQISIRILVNGSDGVVTDAGRIICVVLVTAELFRDRIVMV